MYTIFQNNKQEENPEITKKRTSFSITTLNTMNKNDLKNICTDYGIRTGNLKKNNYYTDKLKNRTSTCVRW